MTIPPREPLDQLSETVKDSWHPFLDVYEPLRPDVYRYCRYLTRSPWDADDLAQDAMAKAFVTLGCMAGAPRQPSGLAVSRRLEPVDRPGAPDTQQPVANPELAGREAAATVVSPQDSREAAGTLLAPLSPQERAALVLKDVFELTLAEVAEALSTTEGAVKAALHRGRGKLAEPESLEAQESRLPRPAALDEFCDAFKAQDLDRLTALLLDTTSVEVVGVHTEYGGKAARAAAFQGMLFGSRHLRKARASIPRYKQGALPEVPRPELRFHRGEWLVLLWYAHEDGEAVRGFARGSSTETRSPRFATTSTRPTCSLKCAVSSGSPSRLNGCYCSPALPFALPKPLNPPTPRLILFFFASDFFRTHPRGSPSVPCPGLT